VWLPRNNSAFYYSCERIKETKFRTQVRKQDTIHILSTLSDASTMLPGGKAFEDISGPNAKTNSGTLPTLVLD